MKRWKITSNVGKQNQLEHFFDQEDHPVIRDWMGQNESILEDGTIIPAEYTIESWDIVPTQEELDKKALHLKRLEYPTYNEFIEAYFNEDHVKLAEYKNKVKK